MQVLVSIALSLIVSSSLQGCGLGGLGGSEAEKHRGWPHVVATLHTAKITTVDAAWQKMKDKGGDTITAEGLKEKLAGMNFKLPLDECVMMINDIDPRGNGEVNEEDFKKMWENFDMWDQAIQEMKAQELHTHEAAFKKINAAGDGKITVAELHTFLKHKPGLGTKEHCASMAKAVDLDGNGTIEPDEFKEIYDNAAPALEGADTEEKKNSKPAESLLERDAGAMKVSYVEIGQPQGLGKFAFRGQRSELKQPAPSAWY
jgi:Ca2+-binding EF-hand superfamily protein